MSLITGPEWETAVYGYLKRAAPPLGWTARKAQPPGAHRGKGTRFSGAGPADFQIERAGCRIALEVKAHTKQSHARWPLECVKPSQAEDMGAADHAAVLLRFAGYATDFGTLLSADVPDLVYLLDWTDLGPLWWAWHYWPELGAGRAPDGVAGLSEGDCRRLAVAAFKSEGVRLEMDTHGDWTCPDVLPTLIECWGLA